MALPHSRWTQVLGSHVKNPPAVPLPFLISTQPLAALAALATRVLVLPTLGYLLGASGSSSEKPGS